MFAVIFTQNLYQIKLIYTVLVRNVSAAYSILQRHGFLARIFHFFRIPERKLRSDDSTSHLLAPQTELFNSVRDLVGRRGSWRLYRSPYDRLVSFKNLKDIFVNIYVKKSMMKKVSSNFFCFLLV